MDILINQNQSIRGPGWHSYTEKTGSLKKKNLSWKVCNEIQKEYGVDEFKRILRSMYLGVKNLLSLNETLCSLRENQFKMEKERYQLQCKESDSKYIIVVEAQNDSDYLVCDYFVAWEIEPQWGFYLTTDLGKALTFITVKEAIDFYKEESKKQILFGKGPKYNYNVRICAVTLTNMAIFRQQELNNNE